MHEPSDEIQTVVRPSQARQFVAAGIVCALLIALLAGADYYLKNKEKWAQEMNDLRLAQCVSKLDAACIAQFSDPEAVEAYGMTNEQWSKVLREVYEPDPGMRPTFKRDKLSNTFEVQMITKNHGAIWVTLVQMNRPFEDWGDINGQLITQVLREEGMDRVPDPVLTRSSDAVIYGADKLRQDFEAIGLRGRYLRTRTGSRFYSWDEDRERSIGVVRRVTSEPTWEPKALMNEAKNLRPLRGAASLPPRSPLAPAHRTAKSRRTLESRTGR